MSLIVKNEDVFKWTPTSEMDQKTLIDEITRLRICVEKYFWEVESEIEEWSNFEHQTKEISALIKKRQNTKRRLVNQLNARKPRKIKGEDEKALIKEFKDYVQRKGSAYGFHSYIQNLLGGQHRGWGRTAIDRVLREAGLK